MQMQFMGERPEGWKEEQAGVAEKAEAFRQRVFWAVALGAPFFVGLLVGLLVESLI